ncbi:hypothetical protein [Streptomyces sp. NPDC058371]|jgi:hypothetical protein|uniref:hypothetical protein n=1 Tax=Streptomyces sp. NPDC058371 TaxID=3346463 RepID=UPI003646B605
MSAVAVKGTVRGLTWTVLRVHRPALRFWLALVVVASAAMLWAYGPGFDIANSRTYCPVSTDNCDTVSGPWQDQYGSVVALSTLVVAHLPFLVAVWAGATLTGRELESGTAALSWTQSVSPARWLTAKLAVPALLVTAGTAVLVPLHRLMWQGGQDLVWAPWYDADVYHADGPVTVAYALCGLAFGALAGLLLRRSLPALGAAFAALLVVYVLGNEYRPSLWPAVTVTGARALNPPEDALTLQHGVITTDGIRIGNNTACVERADAAEIKRCMTDGHISDFWADYHPRSHFWPLQLVESGVVLALAVSAALAAYAVLRRRTA